MTRYGQFVLATVGILMLGAQRPQLRAEPPGKMNVVILIADDLNTWLLEDPHRYDGRVVAPLLKAPEAPWSSTAISCLTSQGEPVQGYLSIRNEIGRYIRYGEGQEEFYASSEDPHEWTNQIDNPKYSQAVDTLRASVPKLSEMAKPMPRVIRRPRKKR